MRAGRAGWHTLLFTPPMPCLFALHILFIIAWFMFLYLPYEIVLTQCELKRKYSPLLYAINKPFLYLHQ